MRCDPVAGWSRALFSLGMCPHNGKAGAFSCGTTRTHAHGHACLHAGTHTQAPTQLHLGLRLQRTMFNCILLC